MKFPRLEEVENISSVFPLLCLRESTSKQAYEAGSLDRSGVKNNEVIILHQKLSLRVPENSGTGEANTTKNKSPESRGACNGETWKQGRPGSKRKL